MKNWIFATISAALTACQSAPNETETTLTSDQKAAYERCLEQSQAVAMAWEMIEAECLEAVLGKERPEPRLPHDNL